MPRARYCLAALIAFITLATYLPALQNEFVIWDDEKVVVNNLHIRTLGPDLFRWAFADLSFSLWQPAAWISHALDYAVWGLAPAGHHLTSILLHSINAFLVVCTVAVLLEASDRIRVRKGLPAGLSRNSVLIAGGVAGALFGLHPQHVEPAVWITGRTDLLCTLFFLLSIVSYIRYVGQSAGPATLGIYLLNRYYLLSFAFFALALTGKPAAVTLPFVLIILDWYPLERIASREDLLRVAVEKLPFAVVGAALSLVTITAHSAYGIMASMTDMQLPVRAGLAARAFSIYLYKFVIPLQFFPFYPFPEKLDFLSFGSLATTVFEIGLTVLCVLTVKKRPVLLAVWVFFLVTMLPSLAGFGGRISFMADRYAYLPDLGLVFLAGLAAAWGWQHTEVPVRWGHTLRPAAAALVILLLVLLGGLTISQIKTWRNTIVLWSRVIDKEQFRVPVAYNNRGMAFRENGQLDLAIADYTTTILLKPEARTYTNRAIAFAEMGDPDRALEDLDAAIALDPSYADAYTSRGLVFLKKRQPARALADFDSAIGLSPSSVDAYFNRGVAYEQMNQPALAIEDYSRAISLDPRDHLAYGNRGRIFHKVGQFSEALQDFTMVILLKPGFAGAYLDRGRCYQDMGDSVRAGRDFSVACDLGDASACEAAPAQGVQ